MTNGQESAKMSDMRPSPRSKRIESKLRLPRSFTLRDLNRQPAKVLAACDRHGVVRIRTRDGRAYRLKPEGEEPERTAQVESLPARRQRLRAQLRAAGFVPPSPDEFERINRLIAGDE